MKREWEERKLEALHDNNQGDFLYGLLKCAPKDSFTYRAAVVKYKEGNISPSVAANGFLANVANYDDPFVKRLMVTELYYVIIKTDNNREK